MFADAIEAALAYTCPVIISRKTVGGKCSASIGAFVIVNADGWIVTASHILQQMEQLFTESANVQALVAQREAIANDASLGNKERRQKLALLPKLNPKANERASALWALPGLGIADVTYVPGVDIGVGRLTNFTASPSQRFAKFKDPTKGIRLGTSVCRLGYPFHKCEPVWDQQAGRFNLPPEAYPVPIFCSEGIVSRFMKVNVPGAPQPPPFPMTWFETSSPGLKGQSGGPLVDTRGSIWGIQSNTLPYSLGFDPKIIRDGKDQSEHQFLNVGRAVHVETVTGLLRELNVNHELSDY